MKVLDKGSPIYQGENRDIKNLSDYAAYLREETARGFELSESRRRRGEEQLNEGLRSELSSALALRDSRITQAENAAASAGSAASSAASAAAAAKSTADQAATDLAAANQTIATMQKTINDLKGRIENLEKGV